MDFTKQYLSGFIGLFLFLSSQCHNAHYIEQENKGFYTENSYTLATYSSDHFRKLFQEVTEDTIVDFKKQFIKLLPEWKAAGTEADGSTLWRNFQEEQVDPLLQRLKEQGYDITPLVDYYDCFGALLIDIEKTFAEALQSHDKLLIEEARKKAAEEVDDKQVKAASKRLPNQLKQAFQEAVRSQYNSPENIPLTKAILAYQAWVSFIQRSKDQSAGKLHFIIDKWSSDIQQWKKDGRPMGGALWKQISKEEQKLLSNSWIFRYPENQKAIEEALAIADQLADEGYSLNYKAWEETLPHGFHQLNLLFNELPLRETESLKKLKNYCKLFFSARGIG